VLHITSDKAYSSTPCRSMIALAATGPRLPPSNLAVAWLDSAKPPPTLEETWYSMWWLQMY